MKHPTRVFLAFPDCRYIAINISFNSKMHGVMKYLGLYQVTDAPPGWTKRKFTHYDSDGQQWYHYWGKSESTEPKAKPVGWVKSLTKFLNLSDED